MIPKITLTLIVALFGLLVSVSLLNYFITNQFSISANENEHVQKTNWQPTTNATVCNKNLTAFPGEWFLSQSREDRKLLKWFGTLCGGTYLEMGALDGKRFSNSHVFNKGLDWKGLLIEGSPGSYKKLKVNRPNELFTVQAGVCADERMLHYVDSAPAGIRGFVEFAPESFAKQWWTKEQIEAAIEVKCRPLKDILMDTVGPEFHFDFFSLDIEGAEFDALSSLDFDLVSFGILLVEADKHNELKNIVLRSKLESNGYTFIMDSSRSYWFINNDFGRIYSHLIH